MLVSLLLWAATNFPMHNGQPPAIQDSVVASVGHAIEPVIRPLGFDWKIGVGLVTSLAAREVIIATLGTLNGIDAEVALLRSAEGAAARANAAGSGRAAGVLRLRHAVHVHHGGGASRNQRLEVARRPVRLHDDRGVRVGLRRLPHRRATSFTNQVRQPAAWQHLARLSQQHLIEILAWFDGSSGPT